MCIRYACSRYWSFGQTGQARRWLAQQCDSTIDYNSVGRNDPCPCGSGEKCKKCCML